MTFMPFTWFNLSEEGPEGRSSPAVGRDCECSKPLPPDRPATVTAQFRPLDPSIVNETIPAFFIGRNMEGFWVTRDAKGQIGGIFLLEASAHSFAKRNSGTGGCVTIFPSERFELDLENKGNRLARPIASLIRHTHRLQQVLATLLGKTTEVVKRLARDFRAP